MVVLHIPQALCLPCFLRFIQEEAPSTPQELPTLLAYLKMWLIQALLVLSHLFAASHGAPSGFPASGNGLWFTTPGKVWSRDFLPVGNGYLAAMTPGGTTQEATQLNIESLWSGGPFADPSYNGGNKQPSERANTAVIMQNIRQSIFSSATGDIDNVESLATDPGAYGSYAGAGHLLTTLNFSTSAAVTNYSRWLDLDQGLARTSWVQSGVGVQRTTLCALSTRSCTLHTTLSPSSSSSFSLPAISHTFTHLLEPDLPPPNITCISPTTLSVRGYLSSLSSTPTPASPTSMLYEFLIRGSVPSGQGTVRCTQFPVPFGFPPNATLDIIPSSTNGTLSTLKEAWITWVGDTNYSLLAGDAAHNYSFAGPDPRVSLLSLLDAASPSSPSTSSSTFQTLLTTHTRSYQALTQKFSLSLSTVPQVSTPTDELKAKYSIDAAGGNGEENRYLEWVLFNYGRYLLASSAPGSLPANLQGKWANGLGNAWSADYHSNINIQMNYWSAEMTNLDVTKSLFDYFEKTWAPRGAYTAQVLYNITRGWVVHNEMNIFGHTGMKASGNSAEWANYPESNVWMMIHVWDHFDYTNDLAWFKSQGWPLLKGVASFHLDKLVTDLHFNDSSLVVNPCNSPEQAPITFGCAHAQQMIWQLFNSIEKGFAASGDKDTAFLTEVRAKRAAMDKGLHVGSWGQLQEWKVDQDSPTDTHRHLSHLIGLYPGYAIASYDPSIQALPSPQTAYTKKQVLDAVTTSLIHRGNGTGPDADSGWEKAWRAAAWAQLGDADTFYHELSYAIFENFGPNLFSLYNPFDPNPIFQIDANLAYPAAVMNALLQAPDVASLSTPLTITLLPALPTQWPTGSIKGTRVRGGITLDLAWSGGKPTSASIKVDSGITPRSVKVVYKGKTLASFKTSPGLTRSFSSF
ncbi:Six-hairpin glycosidase-like protein [Crucibulum laeve]|uniref:Six-hairpin glycosidase-like protein n=1 Tax=Crucibulum laeve TaxID=68775 RepID=A0A5C3LYR1_9AGAR|nr:Six-hairpin glycosidase-like protein [Crucibulum laeve]